MSENSIGDVLRLAREQQSLTLQDAADALNIKREYLEDLEKNEYNAIPGAVFVKGFIRNYGNYLGLDGVALAREYRLTIEESTPRPEVRTIMPVRKKKKKPAQANKKKQRQGKWPEISIVAGIIIFLLLIIWLLI